MAAKVKHAIALSQALLQAAETGDADEVAALLDRGASPVLLDPVSGHTPLTRAVAEGHAAVAELLLARGADPCAADYSGCTPLHSAAEANLVDLAVALLKMGADPNAADQHGRTPLDVAQEFCHLRVLAVLLQYGAAGLDVKTLLQRKEALRGWTADKDDKAALKTVLLMAGRSRRREKQREGAAEEAQAPATQEDGHGESDDEEGDAAEDGCDDVTARLAAMGLPPDFQTQRQLPLEHICAAVVKNAVSEIALNFEPVGDDGMLALAEALRENHSVERILAKNAQVGARGLEALARGLERHPAIKHLGLGSNPAGDEAACAALGTAIRNSVSLEELWLDRADVRERGACALAEAVRGAYTLGKLVLRRNAVGDQGAAAFAAVLADPAGKCPLTELLLGNNGITNEGARQLVSATCRPDSRLRKLELSNNPIDEAGGQFIAQSLRGGRSSLSKLSLGGTDVSKELQQEISRLLAQAAAGRRRRQSPALPGPPQVQRGGLRAQRRAEKRISLMERTERDKAMYIVAHRNNGRADVETGTVVLVPKSFELLMEAITRKLGLSFSAQKLFCAETGQPLTERAELRADMRVIVTAGEAPRKPGSPAPAPVAPRNADARKARVAFVHINGKYAVGQGVRLVVPTHWAVFLEAATKRLQLPRAAARAFAIDGRELRKSEDIDDGAAVVVSMGEPLRPLDQNIDPLAQLGPANVPMCGRKNRVRPPIIYLHREGRVARKQVGGGSESSDDDDADRKPVYEYVPEEAGLAVVLPSNWPKLNGEYAYTLSPLEEDRLWNELLWVCGVRLELPWAVRSLRHLDGKEVAAVADIKDGMHVIAATRAKSRGTKKTAPAPPARAITYAIHVHRNGQPLLKNPPKVLLSKVLRTDRHLVRVLEEAQMAMDLVKAAQRLFTMDGEEITDASELLHRAKAVDPHATRAPAPVHYFVSCGEEFRYPPDPKRKKKKPPQRSSAVARIRQQAWAAEQMYPAEGSEASSSSSRPARRMVEDPVEVERILARVSEDAIYACAGCGVVLPGNIGGFYASEGAAVFLCSECFRLGHCMHKRFVEVHAAADRTAESGRDALLVYSEQTGRVRSKARVSWSQLPVHSAALSPGPTGARLRQ